MDKQIKPIPETNISGEEYIWLMFERTSEDGILYISLPRLDGTDAASANYRCCMQWNLGDFEKIQTDYTALYADLQLIAAVYDDIGNSAENAGRLLGSGHLFYVWNTFIRRFETANAEKISDIQDRVDVLEEIRDIARRISAEEAVDDWEKDFIQEHLKTAVSRDEWALLNADWESRYRQAGERVGSNICAYLYVVSVMRVCRLISMHAPEAVLTPEARQMAAAMVLHRHARSMEAVSSSVLRFSDRLEAMTEDELDEYYRPKKSNSRKSMAPLYIYHILKEHSSADCHLRQQDILNLLREPPYELCLERKALSRILHNLLDDGQWFLYKDKSGVWIE